MSRHSVFSHRLWHTAAPCRDLRHVIVRDSGPITPNRKAGEFSWLIEGKGPLESRQAPLRTREKFANNEGMPISRNPH